MSLPAKQSWATAGNRPKSTASATAKPVFAPKLRAGLEFLDIMECTLRREEYQPVLGFAVALSKPAEQ